MPVRNVIQLARLAALPSLVSDTFKLCNLPYALDSMISWILQPISYH